MYRFITIKLGLFYDSIFFVFYYIYYYLKNVNLNCHSLPSSQYPACTSTDPPPTTLTLRDYKETHPVECPRPSPLHLCCARFTSKEYRIPWSQCKQWRHISVSGSVVPQSAPAVNSFERAFVVPMLMHSQSSWGWWASISSSNLSQWMALTLFWIPFSYS